MAALNGVGDNIAHDLRTPLTSVRARLERSLQMAGPDTQLGQSITQSIHGVDQGLSIITALLRISEIRHIHRQSGFETFDLSEVVRITTENYLPVAEEKGVSLTAAYHPSAMIVGDRQLLIEALVNVVDNAIKFTPGGGAVSVRLQTVDEGPIIKVADSGPGIAPHARTDVFSRFFREDTSRSTSGSGLGLSLVAEVMRLHGFAISVGDNAPGCRIEMRCWFGSDRCDAKNMPKFADRGLSGISCVWGGFTD
jgi:signal transduction histidine kinase